MQTKGYIVFFELHNSSGCLYMNAFRIYLKGLKCGLLKIEGEKGKGRRSGEACTEGGRRVLRTVDSRYRNVSL